MADFHVKMGPKSAAKPKLANPTPIQLPGTGTINIYLDPIDASGNDVPVTNPANHAGTLTGIPATQISFAPGADTLHYTATIPAGTPASSSITLNGTDHAVDGSFPDLAASCVVVTPPSPPVLPADLKINVSFGS